MGNLMICIVDKAQVRLWFKVTLVCRLYDEFSKFFSLIFILHII